MGRTRRSRSPSPSGFDGSAVAAPAQTLREAPNSDETRQDLLRGTGRRIRLRRALPLLAAAGLALGGCGGGGGGGSDPGAADAPASPAWRAAALTQVAAGGLTTPWVAGAADAGGRLHVAFFEPAGGAMYRVAYLAWDPSDGAAASPDETVARVDNCQTLALAVGPDGDPAVAYRGGELRACGAAAQSDAMVALRAGGFWHERTAAVGENPRNPVFRDGLAGTRVAAAVGPDGVLHLAYQFNYEGCDAMNFRYPDLRYVRIDPADPGSEPREEVVEGNTYGDSPSQNSVGFHAALTVDPDGSPVVFHYAELPDGTRGLRVARRVDGQWVSGWVETGCEVGAVAASPAGADPAAAYVIERCTDGRDDRGTLRFARAEGDGWALETVDATVRCAGELSLGLDPDGRPAIAYHELETYAGRDLGNLKLARFDGASWDLEAVASQGDIGRYNAVWTDAEGRLQVMGYSATDHTIYVFQRLETRN